MASKKGLFLKKPKQSDKFTASKTRKSALKVSKTQNGNELSIVSINIETY